MDINDWTGSNGLQFFKKKCLLFTQEQNKQLAAELKMP